LVVERDEVGDVTQDVDDQVEAAFAELEPGSERFDLVEGLGDDFPDMEGIAEMHVVGENSNEANPDDVSAAPKPDDVPTVKMPSAQPLKPTERAPDWLLEEINDGAAVLAEADDEASEIPSEAELNGSVNEQPTARPPDDIQRLIAGYMDPEDRRKYLDSLREDDDEENENDDSDDSPPAAGHYIDARKQGSFTSARPPDIIYEEPNPDDEEKATLAF